MSDLISRNRAISILEQLDEHSLSGKMDISNAIYLLENQPATYDIDKVVAELERFPLGNLGCQELNEIIEIVKQGGVRKESD